MSGEASTPCTGFFSACGPLTPQPLCWKSCPQHPARQSSYAKARAHGERYAVHLRVPPGEGEAVLVWEDEGFLVKTWIHQGSMSGDRCGQWAQALAGDNLLCA